MLRPLYTNRATQLLLIGPPASGKRTLAKQLLRSSMVFYSTKILEELDPDCFDRLVDIDYVLIFVDMTNPASMTLLNETLTYMEPDYLLCKCAVIFTKVDLVNFWMLDEDNVRELVEQFGGPYTFHVNLKDGPMRKTIIDKITRAICIGTFQYQQVHPLGVRLLENTAFAANVDTYDTNVPNDDQGEHQQDQSEEEDERGQVRSEQGGGEEDHVMEGQSEQDEGGEDHSMDDQSE